MPLSCQKIYFSDSHGGIRLIFAAEHGALTHPTRNKHHQAGGGTYTCQVTRGVYSLLGMRPVVTWRSEGKSLNSRVT